MLKIHFCQQCQAEYVCWDDDQTIGSVNLYTTINDKMYRWSVSPFDKTGRLWFIKTPGVMGQIPNKDLVLLKVFEEFAPVTPQNIKEKIRLMLTFL